MKSRLNLTIDTDLLLTIKSLTKKNPTSISEMVEEYFKEPVNRKNIIDLVESLPASKINNESDLKDLFYRTQSQKYNL